MLPSVWSGDDIRAWRGRLRWTQAQASDALCYHVEAYKKLECGTRVIVPRIRRMCLLTERDHVRSLAGASAGPGGLQVFATVGLVIGRMEALAQDGKLIGKDGRAHLRYASLFSGMDGATAALERIGSTAVPVCFSEIDPAANAVLRHRWPDVPRVGDATGFDWASLRGHVDLVVGGSPCQPFSVSGRWLGLADPRGNLALHFCAPSAPCDRGFSSMKTFLASSTPTTEPTGKLSSPRWRNSGAMTPDGVCSTRSTSECPRDGGVCGSLPNVLDPEVDPNRYSISPRGTAAVLSQAARRGGKPLPAGLMAALES